MKPINRLALIGFKGLIGMLAVVATLLSQPFLMAGGQRALPSPQSQPSTPVGRPSIVLERPDLKANQSVREIDIRTEVEEKTDAVAVQIPAQVGGAGVPVDVTRESIIQQIPVGYGTLMRTSNVRDPGKPVDSSDPRVIPLLAQPAVERVIGRTNLLPVRFLEAGVIASRPVARVAIKFTDLPEAGLGTGFMVGQSLFLTNNHVIGTVDFASKLELHFNYQYGLDGRIAQHVVYELDPAGFFLTNQELDFTLVRVRTRSGEDITDAAATHAGDEFGFIPLRTNFFYSPNQLANVVQHPMGRPKEIAIQENQVAQIYQDVIRYTTDTEPGSSGSPVFNNGWRVISLHHAAGQQDQQTGKWLNNEGIRIDRIIEAIKKLAAPAIQKELGL